MKSLFGKFAAYCNLANKQIVAEATKKEDQNLRCFNKSSSTNVGLPIHRKKLPISQVDYMQLALNWFSCTPKGFVKLFLLALGDICPMRGILLFSGSFPFKRLLKSRNHFNGIPSTLSTVNVLNQCNQCQQPVIFFPLNCATSNLDPIP